MSDEKSLDLVQRPQHWFPTPKEFEEMKAPVLTLIKSGLLPKHIDTPEKAIMIALKGRELGIPPIQAMSKLYVVQGKVGIEAEQMMAMIRERCPTAVIQIVKSDRKICVIRASRKGHDPQDFSFTEEDALAAGLLAKRGVWDSYRDIMLRARCISKMARFLFPDVIGGASYTPEELGARLDSKGEIVVEPSEAEELNAEIAKALEAPVDLETYVIPVGNLKGKLLKDCPKESLLRARDFLRQKRDVLDPAMKGFLAALEQYLPDGGNENEIRTNPGNDRSNSESAGAEVTGDENQRGL